MQTERWALLGPSSSCRVQISQATRLVSLKTDLCAVFPARRDELCLRLAGLDAEASRLELGSSKPQDYPQIKTPLSAGAFLCGPPGEIRTPDTQVRSLVLYPAELRAEARKLRFTVYKGQDKDLQTMLCLQALVSSLLKLGPPALGCLTCEADPRV